MRGAGSGGLKHGCAVVCNDGVQGWIKRVPLVQARAHYIDGRCSAGAVDFHRRRGGHPEQVGHRYTSHGSTMSTPVSAKSMTLRVTTTLLCTRAVAAIRASAIGRVRCAISLPHV